ncbi:hypothetical protein [Amycolatopsis keratiniphila]|uniref:Uncharacterized protein n=1 Tax=Amycolatopsis keratiniphila subsp. keratiniphila TaxID=227715 RepID=A0A1W2LZB0_9PSEU|nr:hypothetical protein [Amycolatopsis keratiniphila]OLZ58772.1 hypothetical protein BS330_10160 [Amycolatopsis keratiniphila subsp. nogabecina]ONF72566.1 hypothetical protein AVR91_0210260 [Amycolatopsis keratiniphila subsp. keratiniphila]SDU69675.1 hypothetical protein SAMN04489733_8548 [Amycolatopsis keratiniphila]
MTNPEIDLDLVAGQRHVSLMNDSVGQIQDGQQRLNSTTEAMMAMNSGRMNIAANDAYSLLGTNVTKVGADYTDTADGIHYGLQTHGSADAEAAAGFNYGR